MNSQIAFDSIEMTNEGLLIKSPKLIFDLKRVIEKAVLIFDWENIPEPTISEVSEYVGLSVDKIKKDLKNIDCPLRQSYKGGKGRGNEMKFFKASVTLYKKWITEK